MDHVGRGGGAWLRGRLFVINHPKLGLVGGFARQTTGLGEHDGITEKGHDQKPGIAFEAQQHAPAQQEADHQICKNRQEKLHGGYSSVD
jgi:hypothetical protein